MTRLSFLPGFRMGGLAIALAIFVGCSETATAPETFDSTPLFGLAGHADNGHGKIFFASTRDGDPEIYVMNPDGSGQKRLTNNPAFDTEPRGSRDGRRIVFGSDRNSTPPFQEIWIMDAHGKHLRQVTSSPAHTDFFPHLSPNGRRIAFNRGQQPPPGPGFLPSIFVINVNGSGERNLTNNPEVCVPPFPAADCYFEAWPRWSPNGKRILFNRAQVPGDFDIYVMYANGTGRTNLTPDTDGINDFFADWSPDGKHIAFTSSRDGPPDVYIMKADGSNVRKLTPESGPNFAPVWSPHGKKIAFHSFRAGTADIYTINVDGTNETQVTFDPADDLWPSWTGDGHHRRRHHLRR